ncbi:phosphoglycerate dehydrogenase [Ectothiorhodospira variabilis]|uniref:phosphoglycerate dehydrogenase n=1 Tax=Ectothiorhodospira variabilis TaxID=505694 RepID=UPI001EFB432D|nr:phosphoglycerate dehydrogenase [Ectothiorhodospira variabilis]MCG5497796.1 phosphoglycerate dehydrogenase [Ectothiorhodospira variabilis]
MTDKRAYISTSSFGTVDQAPIVRLQEAGFEISLNPFGRALKAEEVLTEVRDHDILIAGTEPLGATVLEQLAGRLKVISRVGMGMDKIDHDATRRLGITVRNTPSAHVDAVAELALAGILDLCRGLSAADRGVRSGSWKKPMGRLLRGRTVGFVGYGGVARALKHLLTAFDVRLLATDPALSPAVAEAEGVELLTIQELFERAEVVSLHLPGGADTKGMIDTSLLERLPPTAVLVNTARGDVIVEEDLLRFLQANPSASAYLDVFEQEPYFGPLRELSNCVLSPHIGSYAMEARVRMEAEAVENALLAFAEAV